MRVLLAVNGGKEMGVRKAEELAGWLASRGVEVSSIDSENIIRNGRFSEEAAERCAENPNLICTFGGDGTLLSAAQMVFRNPTPILGLNFGTLGFLTGATGDAMTEAVEAALEGKLPMESRCALNVTMEDDSGDRIAFTVLNEVALTRGSMGRIVDYRIMIDGDKLSNMRADGVIVSSPTGSTAYSLSAGGPILTPTINCMVVSALAPHSLISRAIITGEDQTVEIVPDEKSSAECFIFVDGNRVCVGRRPARITATVRKDAVKLLRYNMPSFTVRASQAFYGERQ